MSNWRIGLCHVTVAPDAVAGHDLLDSTTVAERFQPVTLQDDFSLHGVHIGIPMVCGD